MGEFSPAEGLCLVGPAQFGQRGDAQIGEFDLILCRIRLGAFNDRIGFRGAAGIEQPACHAGIVAHPRAETLLSGTVGIDIAGRIREISQCTDQLPRA